MSDDQVIDTREGDDEEVEVAEDAPRLVVPELDGSGGTKYVYGGTDEEASEEEWLAQQGGGVTTDDEEVAPVEEDDE